MDSLLLRGQKAAEQTSKDAPHRGAVGAGDDAYSGATSVAKDTSELLQSEAGIWKELQTKLADNSVKAAIGERQCLPVRRYWQKGRLIQSVASTFEHGRSDIGADQASRWTNGRRDSDSGFPGSGAHIEHLSAWLNISGFEHKRYEKPGPPAGELLIRRCIDGVAWSDVEPRCTLGLHGLLRRQNSSRESD